MNKKSHRKSILVKLSLVLYIWGGLGVNKSTAQDKPIPDSTEIQKQIVDLVYNRFHFLRGYGIPVQINKDGILINFEGEHINLGLTSSDPVERANRFFERNQDLFQIHDSRSELVFRGKHQYPNGFGIIDFDQIVGGAKVYFGGYRIQFKSDSISTNLISMYSIGIGYVPAARDIHPIPTIDSLEAGRIAQADPDNNGFRTYTGNYELYVSSTYDGIHKFDDGRVHLIWLFGLGGGIFSGSAIYIVDAHTGEILKTMNGLR